MTRKLVIAAGVFTVFSGAVWAQGMGGGLPGTAAPLGLGPAPGSGATSVVPNTTPTPSRAPTATPSVDPRRFPAGTLESDRLGTTGTIDSTVPGGTTDAITGAGPGIPGTAGRPAIGAPRPGGAAGTISSGVGGPVPGGGVSGSASGTAAPAGAGAGVGMGGSTGVGGAGAGR